MANDNSAAFKALQAQIDALNSLDRAPTELAQELAPVLDEEIRAQIARGQDPEGKPWQRGKDGQPVLRTAGKALSVVAIGSTVVASLTGHVALHHYGTAKGGVKRQILPTRRLPQPAIEAMRKVIERYLAEKLKP